MANVTVTQVTAASNSAIKTAIEGIDERKYLKAFYADGMIHIVARTNAESAGGGITIVVAANDSLNKDADYVCDGTADDVEINAALAALPSQGGRVILMEGTFNIIQPIDFPDDDITLMGVGRSTFIDGDGLATTEHGITISGRTNCMVKDLAIQTGDGVGNTSHCIFIEDGSNDFIIENVIILDSDSDGIHVEGTTITDGHIRECKIVDTDDNGIFVDMDAANYCDRLKITDNTILSSGSDGIEIGATGAGTRYCTISGNHINGATVDGMNISEATSGLVSDNIIENCTQEGIYATGSDTLKIEGNQCVSNTRYGIYLDQSNYSALNGNVCYNNDSGGTTYSGIYVTVSDHVSITGNNCSANGLHGIFMFRSDYCTISGNTCVDQNTGDGIIITGDATGNADYNQVTGNTCTGNADDGIEIAQTGATANGNTIAYNMVRGNSGTTIVDGGTLSVIRDNEGISFGGEYGTTLVVSASDSIQPANADYVCDGTADNVQIAAALAALPAGGGEVRLQEGTYDIAAPVIVTDNQKLKGSNMFATVLDNSMTVQVIDNCEDAWNSEQGGNVVCAVDAVNFKVGAGSAEMTVAAGVGATSLIATEAVTSMDLSSYHRIGFWARCSIATDDGDLQIHLDDTANCASPIKTLDLRGMDADTWTYHDLDLGDASGLTAVISVGVYQVTDLAAMVLLMDDVQAFNYTVMVEDATAPVVGAEVADIGFSGNGGGILLNGVTQSTFSNLYATGLDLAGICLSGDATYGQTWYNEIYNLNVYSSRFGMLACAEDTYLTNTHVHGGVLNGNDDNLHFNCHGSGHVFSLVTFESGSVTEIFNKAAAIDLFGCRVESASDIVLGASGILGHYGGTFSGGVAVTGNTNGYNRFDNEQNKVTRNAEFYVAANDADTQCLAQADYVCDGTADEVQINNAISSLPATDGGRVMLSAGTFTIADQIVINRPNVILQGAGFETFIDGDALTTTNHAISITGNTDNEVCDLSIQTEDGGGKTCHCVYISNAHRTKVRRVKILDSDADGVHVAGGAVLEDIEVSDCEIDDTDGAGIYCDVAATETMIGFKILNNRIKSSGSQGIFVGDTGAATPTSTYWHIRGNMIENTTSEGIYVQDMYYSNINDNTIENAGGDGIRTFTPMNYTNINDNIIVNPATNCILAQGLDLGNIVGNNCFSSGASGINIFDSPYANITGNTCTSNTAEGILVRSASTGCTVTGNNCRQNSADGIEVQNTTHCVVSGNSCHGNSRNIYVINSDHTAVTGNGANASGGSEGIFVWRSNYCTVSSNSCADNTNEGIRIEGDATTNADYNVISGNTCTGNGTQGIEIDGGTDANKNIVTNNASINNTGANLDDAGTLTEISHNIIV